MTKPDTPRFVERSNGIEPDPEGVFVFYEDYQNLERELAEANRLNLALHQLATIQINQAEQRLAEAEKDKELLDWADGAGHYDARYDSMREELRDKGSKLDT